MLAVLDQTVAIKLSNQMNKISYKSKEKLYSTNFQFIKTYNRNPVRLIRQEQYTHIGAELKVQKNYLKIFTTIAGLIL